MYFIGALVDMVVMLFDPSAYVGGFWTAAVFFRGRSLALSASSLKNGLRNTQNTRREEARYATAGRVRWARRRMAGAGAGATQIFDWFFKNCCRFENDE
jgi:hypothetical protein|tara:strand:- start:525 stop:821 length:297 start_codon:yes stop_codon:yes gene_type:complete